MKQALTVFALSVVVFGFGAFVIGSIIEAGNRNANRKRVEMTIGAGMERLQLTNNEPGTYQVGDGVIIDTRTGQVVAMRYTSTDDLGQVDHEWKALSGQKWTEAPAP